MKTGKRVLLSVLKKAVREIDAVTKLSAKEGLNDEKLMAIADELEMFITDELRDEYGLERASHEYESL